MLEFDQQGHLLRHWGPGPGDPWMDQEHGIQVDHRNNVWFAGGGGDDSQILKYTGSLLLSLLDRFDIHQDSIGDSTGRLEDL